MKKIKAVTYLTPFKMNDGEAPSLTLGRTYRVKWAKYYLDSCDTRFFILDDDNSTHYFDTGSTDEDLRTEEHFYIEYGEEIAR